MEYITYEEFKEEVGKLGCEVVYTSDRVWVQSGAWLTAKVEKDTRFHITTYRKETVTPELEKAMELSMRLAYTPLDEREGRYYLRLKCPIISEKDSYLNYNAGDGGTILDTKMDDCGYQTIFTKKEIDELHEEYKVLDSFRMEAVK